MTARNAFFAALLGYCAWAQDNIRYRVDTVAGHLPNQDGIPANEALFLRPQAIAASGIGDIYVSDPFHGFRAIYPDGKVATVTPSIPPTQAIATDASGTLYSVQGPEMYSRTPGGEGRTSRPFSNLPMPRAPMFTSVAVGPDGTPIIADSNNRVVARVNADGSVQPIAGLGSRVNLDVIPNRLAIDAKGNVFIAARSQIFRLTTEGELSLFAGNGEFTQIGSIACGKAGELYVVDAFTQQILSITADGVIGGVLWEGNAVDLAVEASGTLLVLDGAGFVVRVESSGAKTTVAGRLPYGGDGGPSKEALLNLPAAVVPDTGGGYFIADTGNHRIRRVSADGVITTVAGTGVPGFDGDGGPGTEAQLAGPTLLATDAEGNVYFAAQGFSKVRRLRPDGIVETVAGTGGSGDSGDGGPAVDATLQSVAGLAVDKLGALYISDRLANRVRVVKNGVISAYAGTGARGIAGDGPARSTPLAGPTLLAVDAAGDLFLYESSALRLRKVDSVSGAMTTVTPVAPLGVPGDGSAVNRCSFNALSGISFDEGGNLLVAGNSRVCRYGKDGKSTILAGSANSGFGGDGGPALDALFGPQIGVTADAAGGLLLADTVNLRIRRLAK